MGKDVSSISVVGGSCATSSLSRSMLDQKSAGGKLHLKWYQHLIFRYTPVFALEQTMCSCGSWHTLLSFQLELFLEIFFPTFCMGPGNPFQTAFLRRGDALSCSKNDLIRKPCSQKARDFSECLLKSCVLVIFDWISAAQGHGLLLVKKTLDFISGGYVGPAWDHETPQVLRVKVHMGKCLPPNVWKV